MYVGETKKFAYLTGFRVILLKLEIIKILLWPGTLPVMRRLPVLQLLFIFWKKKLKVSKDVPMSESLREKRELRWTQKLNTLISKGINIIECNAVSQESERV